MGKYTVTVNYLLKNNIPIWTFENIVSNYYDEYFTAGKWLSLKNLFETKYLYEEIGNETVELWNHYIFRSFLERIEPYKQALKTLTLALEQDRLKEFSSTESTSVSTSLLPYNTTGVLGNVSDTQQSNRTSSGYNESPINQFDNFYKKFRDLDDEFIEGFRHNFMEVY